MRGARRLVLATLLLAPAPAAAQDPAASPPAEDGGSLFTPQWNEIELGLRVTDSSGDEARFQRYQDLRSGPLLDGGRYRHDTELWSVSFSADNVGYRDQRFEATYERVGRFEIAGLWDQVPQFYSIDTRTPYTPIGASPMGLDDATQRAIQLGQTTTLAYIPQAVQFDMRERRDTGAVAARMMPTVAIDIVGAFATTSHSGELPWGASFGFANDVEVALPFDSRTNDLSLGAEWATDRGMIRVGFDGSWFDNQADTLVWDSPLRIDPIVDGPALGRMALWPSNSAQTVSLAGQYRLPRRTQASAFLSFGSRDNDAALMPFTINPAVPQLALPRATTEGEAQIFSANLNLVSRPLPDWRFSARLRRYDLDNETPPTLIPELVSYDSHVTPTPTGGPELFAHDRTTLQGDAMYTGLGPVALTVGYTLNDHGWEHRIFEGSTEHAMSVTADAVGTAWASFRVRYERASREGDGLDEQSLIEIGEQPALRHYDLANRDRDTFTGQVDLTPHEQVAVSVSIGLGNDDYPDSYFGLQEASFRLFTAAVDVTPLPGWGAGGSYSFERYEGLQRSRTANPGPQAADPSRDWTVDSAERVHYFSLFVHPPRYRNTEARLSYDYARATNRFVYGVVPGGPIAPPQQLPEVFNRLQQLRADVRHRLSGRLRASLSYLYEPFDIFDFAFDPGVIDGIIQPSSLVLGYVYRPYTAHSVRFGLMYAW